LIATLGVAVLRPADLARWTPWNQSPEWARLVFQFAQVVLVLVGAAIPIIRWYEGRAKREEEQRQERILRIVETKPIVVTDYLADGTYQIRSVGGAFAFNVWLVIAELTVPVALGSLDKNESRIISSECVVILRESKTERHLLIAEARPSMYQAPEMRRPFTVTLNARVTPPAVQHWLDDEPGERLTRGGTIEEYLAVERVALIAKLNEKVESVLKPSVAVSA